MSGLIALACRALALERWLGAKRVSMGAYSGKIGEESVRMALVTRDKAETEDGKTSVWRKAFRPTREILDLHRMRNIRRVLHVYRNRQFAPWLGSWAELRTQLNQNEAGLPGGGAPLRNVSKTPHLLQELHYLYFGSHTSVLASVTAVHVPLSVTLFCGVK